MAQNRQFLELHGNQYRVVLIVPTELRSKLGTKLKRPLKTDSLSLTNRLKWPVVAELKEIIAAARNTSDGVAAPSSGPRTPLPVQTDEGAGPGFDSAVTRRVAEILALTVPVAGSRHDLPAPKIEEQKSAPASLSPAARSTVVTVKHHYAAYHERLVSIDKLHIRTIDDDKRAIDTFERWRLKGRIADDLALITTKVAKTFAAELSTFEKVISQVTCKKYIVRLRQYWAHMAYLELVDVNPFLSVQIKTPKTEPDEKERPFTDDEVRRLLMGSQHLKDLMMFGALTGARLDGIVELQVQHTLNGCLTIKRQKKEAGPRDIPAHSALAEIIERRTAGKEPDDWLFPEYPPPKKADSLKRAQFSGDQGFHDIPSLHRRG